MLMKKFGMQMNPKLGSYFIGIGMFCLFFAKMLDFFWFGNIYLAFIIGLLHGLSITMNLFGIFYISSNKQKISQKDMNICEKK
jgi:hypothetical protein